MEKGKSFVRVFTSKGGKRCMAVVVPYGQGADGNPRQKLIFADSMTFMTLLDLAPAELYELPNGDYEIK